MQYIIDNHGALVFSSPTAPANMLAGLDETVSQPVFSAALGPLDYLLAPPTIVFGIPACLFG